MIQRIQTVYLLLSALLLGLMFFLPLAHAIGPENSVFRIMVWSNTRLRESADLTRNDCNFCAENTL